MKRLAMIAAMVAALAGAGCATTPSTLADSGIRGRTMVDGGCPLVRNATPCPDKPLAAHLVVTHPGSEQTIATADSGDDGAFRIPLPAGEYVIHGSNRSGGLHPAAAPVTVTVQNGQFTEITVPFDSGIR